MSIKCDKVKTTKTAGYPHKKKKKKKKKKKNSKSEPELLKKMSEPHNTGTNVARSRQFHISGHKAWETCTYLLTY